MGMARFALMPQTTKRVSYPNNSSLVNITTVCAQVGLQQSRKNRQLSSLFYHVFTPEETTSRSLSLTPRNATTHITKVSFENNLKANCLKLLKLTPDLCNNEISHHVNWCFELSIKGASKTDWRKWRSNTELYQILTSTQNCPLLNWFLIPIGCCDK